MKINDAYQDVCLISNSIPDFSTNIIFWALQIFTGVTGIVHHGEEIVLHTNELVVLTLDIGHFHVVSRWTDIFKFLSCDKKKLFFFFFPKGSSLSVPVNISRATK